MFLSEIEIGAEFLLSFICFCTCACVNVRALSAATDPGFSKRGANPKEGTTYDLAKICQKVHENKELDREEGVQNVTMYIHH